MKNWSEFFFFKSKKLSNSGKYGLALLQIFSLEIKSLKVKLYLQSMLINKKNHLFTNTLIGKFIHCAVIPIKTLLL